MNPKIYGAINTILFLLLFIISLLIAYLSIGNIINANSKVFLIAVLITIFESPFLYFYLCEKKMDTTNKFYSNDKFLLGLNNIIWIPIIAVILNVTAVFRLNVLLDNSPNTLRYVAVTQKDETNTIKNKYGIYNPYRLVHFTSWVPGDLSFSVQGDKYYNQFEKGDVVKVNTKAGLFGYEYYEEISPQNKVDKNLFAKYTVFPLTENDFQLMKEDAK